MAKAPFDSSVPSGRDPERFDRDRRRLLWAMPSGLYLVGSRHGEMRNLMTANWAMQVATSPKLLAISVERSARTCQLVEASAAFSLALLSKADRALVRRFVKPAELDLGASTLNGVPFRDGATLGAPIPVAALGAFECRVVEQLGLGSHVMFVGEVVDVHLRPSPDASDGKLDKEVLAMGDTRMSYGG